MYIAAQKGQLPVLKELADRGADINKPNVRAHILLPAHPLA